MDKEIGRKPIMGVLVLEGLKIASSLTGLRPGVLWTWECGEEEKKEEEEITDLNDVLQKKTKNTVKVERDFCCCFIVRKIY